MPYVTFLKVTATCKIVDTLKMNCIILVLQQVDFLYNNPNFTLGLK